MKPGIWLACLLLATAGCGSKPAWEALPLGTKADFRDIWFNDAMHGWIAGGIYEITGGIVGVGASQRLAAVRWGVAGRVVWAWVFTIPGAAMVAALSYGVLELF